MRATSFPPPLRVFAARRVFPVQCFFVFCALLSTFIFYGCAAVSARNSATDPAAALISVVPAEIDFKSVVVGQQNSQTVQITNTSAKEVDLNALHVSGASFTLLSARAPVVLAPGINLSVTIVFAPSRAASAESGVLTIASPDLKTPVRVPLFGSGEKPAPGLQASPSAIDFGNHSVNSSAFQTVTLANTGNTSLTINSASIAGSGYSITGLAAAVSLSPGQRLAFQVWFLPTAAGNSSGSLAIGSSSLPTPLKLFISGSASNSTSTGSPTGSPTNPPPNSPTGSPVGSPTSPPTGSPLSHSVTLNWGPSTSSVSGYHVYRGDSSGGPYNRINGSKVIEFNYMDASVQSGGRYFYVVTAVGTDEEESPYSNEVVADIPNP